MKNIKEYIKENQNFLVNKKLKNRQQQYEYHPQDRVELINILIDLVNNGITDFNNIDVSNITNFSWLFYEVKKRAKKRLTKFNVSQWDVSNATNIQHMFRGCGFFNCDISNWDVSKVENMLSTFAYCKRFNCDLSRWNVSNVKNMQFLFQDCETLDFDISKWNINNIVKTNTAFNYWMFHGCKKLLENNRIPDWYYKNQ